MVIPTAGYGDTGSGVWIDGAIYAGETEYGCTIHCNATGSIPLQVNGADAGYMGLKTLVASGGTGTDGG